MKKIIIFLVSFGILSIYFVNAVYAQEKAENIPSPTPQNDIDYNLPFPGLLPDHPLYSLKLIRDKILIIFTRNPVKKANLNQLFADKYLVMGQMLWEKGNTASSIKTFTTGEKHLLTTAVQLSKLKQSGTLPAGIVEKLESACDKHRQVIENLTRVADQTDKQQLDEVLGINHQARQQATSLK